jgi:hypothetical protein
MVEVIGIAAAYGWSSPSNKMNRAADADRTQQRREYPQLTSSKHWPRADAGTRSPRLQNGPRTIRGPSKRTYFMLFFFIPSFDILPSLDLCQFCMPFFDHPWGSHLVGSMFRARCGTRTLLTRRGLTARGWRAGRNTRNRPPRCALREPPSIFRSDRPVRLRSGPFWCGPAQDVDSRRPLR